MKVSDCVCEWYTCVPTWFLVHIFFARDLLAAVPFQMEIVHVYVDGDETKQNKKKHTHIYTKQCLRRQQKQ